MAKLILIMKKMKNYKNEEFLTINKISEIAKIDCARICSDMNQYFYLNGAIACFIEDTDSDKTMKVIARSLYKYSSPNISLENGEYDIQADSSAETCYLKGFFTSCSFRDNDNQPRIAFKPTEYCTVKHEEEHNIKKPTASFNPFFDNLVIMPLKSADLFKAMDKCRKGLANKALRMEILDEIEKMRSSNKSHNDASSLIRNFCNEENVWYDINHFTKCLIEQCIIQNNGLKESKDLAFITYYRLSEIRDQMEKYGIDFDISTKSDDVNSHTKTLSNNGKVDANKLIPLLLKVKPPNKPLLHSMLKKYIEDTGAKSAPDFDDLLYYIIQNDIEIPLTSEINDKEIKLANERTVKTDNLARAYNRQKIKIKNIN